MSSSFITKFKEFLQFTGHSTRLLVVDNPTFFSNKEVLTFLHIVGITKVRGNANHSESRNLHFSKRIYTYRYIGKIDWQAYIRTHRYKGKSSSSSDMAVG